MAFTRSTLTAELPGISMTVFRYDTKDKGRDLLEKGYFDGAASLLRYGDRICCNCTGGRANEAFDLAVTVEGKNKVSVAPLQAPAPA